MAGDGSQMMKGLPSSRSKSLTPMQKNLSMADKRLFLLLIAE